MIDQEGKPRKVGAAGHRANIRLDIARQLKAKFDQSLDLGEQMKLAALIATLTTGQTKSRKPLKSLFET